MAQEWIKMRAELFTHPRFLSLCSQLVYTDDSPGLLVYTCGPGALELGVLPPSKLSVTERALRCVTERALRDVTMSSLLRVWCAVNAHCKTDDQDAVMCPMTLCDLDDIAGFDGFGDAMSTVGWVREDDASTLRFPNFREYNEPACLRRPAKTGAERQRKYRAKMAVTKSDESDAREEKRREEKNTPPNPPAGGTSGEGKPKRKPKPKQTPEAVPIPASLDSPDFRAVWADWIADRRTRNKPLTELAARKQLDQLAPFGPQQAVEAVKKSIACGWSGVFTDKLKPVAPTAPPPPPGSRNVFPNYDSPNIDPLIPLKAAHAPETTVAAPR